MYHAGRLRKDRQVALEKMGLKWSMTFSTTWEEMFEMLREYVDEKKAKHGGTWDGNVPTNFRTKHIPSVSLGRWVNRQRYRWNTKKLKQEHIEKLTALGIVWSMHKQHGIDVNDADDDEDGDDFVEYHKADVGGIADGSFGGNEAVGADRVKCGKENAAKVPTTSDKDNDPPQPPITASSIVQVDESKDPNLNRVI